MKMIYEEKQNFHVVFLGFLLLLIVIIGTMDFTIYTIYPADWATVVADGTVIFLIFIFVNFRKLEIKITDDFLEFGFGIFRKKIPRKKIISCKTFEVRFGQYFGIGIRYGLNRTILYNTRFGKAVRIKLRGQKRDYVITTNNQKKFCNALKR